MKYIVFVFALLSLASLTACETDGGGGMVATSDGGTDSGGY